MLKYLTALANELDEYGEIKAANMIDILIEKISNAAIDSELPFHETKESIIKYHDWLRNDPKNWINPDLVVYLVKGGKEITDLIHGMSWRNCKLCRSTLVKVPNPNDPLLIEDPTKI